VFLYFVCWLAGDWEGGGVGEGRGLVGFSLFTSIGFSSRIRYVATVSLVGSKTSSEIF